jgi:hypothetical protein
MATDELIVSIGGQRLTPDEMTKVRANWEECWKTAADLKPEWIEVPAHRILKVSRHQLINDFDSYDHNGNCPPDTGAMIFYVYRRSDRKRFKPARFAQADNCGDFVYLEEA